MACTTGCASRTGVKVRKCQPLKEKLWGWRHMGERLSLKAAAFSTLMGCRVEGAGRAGPPPGSHQQALPGDGRYSRICSRRRRLLRPVSGSALPGLLLFCLTFSAFLATRRQRRCLRLIAVGLRGAAANSDALWREAGGRPQGRSGHGRHVGAAGTPGDCRAPATPEGATYCPPGPCHRWPNRNGVPGSQKTRFVLFCFSPK